MSPRVIITDDGSHTLYHEVTGEHYHSTFGALTESLHVFIASGFRSLPAGPDPVHVLEVGLGTGLNALLTMIEAEHSARTVFYDAIEPFPADPSLALSLNYPKILGREDLQETFVTLHNVPADRQVRLNPYFTLKKIQSGLENTSLRKELYDLVYFDAFSPNVQPELWEEAIFSRIFISMKAGGLLVTYCAKGAVSRTMKETGFVVSKLPGPPGKRHMLRGMKGKISM